MANIQPEIDAFRNAIYGEEVRESMISLAEKVNADNEAETERATAAEEELKESLTAFKTAFDELGIYIKDGQIYEKWEEVR